MEEIISKCGNRLVGIAEPKEWMKEDKQRLKETWDTTGVNVHVMGVPDRRRREQNSIQGIRSERSSYLVNNKSRKLKEFQAG